jgi:site-specific DNA-cytosine methylase
MDPIVVLSLFDGCACARVALERAHIPVKTYYASEIDKYAIKVALKNHPDIVQLGDITQWYTWDIEPPDLIIGGSPCQGVSRAGQKRGLVDQRSRLFYLYAMLVKYVYTPRWWVLENTRMKVKDQQVFTTVMGVDPVAINSALVSAQSRDRWYWTNLPVEQPVDKGLLLKDILDCGVVDRDKAYCVDANVWKGTTLLHYLNHHRRQIVFEDAAALESFHRVCIAVRSGEPHKIGFIGKNSRWTRVYDVQGKSVTLASSGGGWGAKTGLYFDNNTIRKLSPVECERLQTLPDGYTEGVSNTQRYKMLGNGFTVDVISHILQGVQDETAN